MIYIRKEKKGFRLIKIDKDGNSYTSIITWELLGNSSKQAFNLPVPHDQDDEVFIEENINNETTH